MPPIEDYDNLDHIHASRTPAGSALLSLSTFIDLHGSTMPHLPHHSSSTNPPPPTINDSSISRVTRLGISAQAWLLDTKKSMSLHYGIVGLYGDIREVHTSLEKDEVSERRRLMEVCKHAHTLCYYQSVLEPKERSRLVSEEASIRRDIDTRMRRSRSQEVPLLVSSNLMLQALDMERVDLHREFTDMLQTILLAERLDREDLVASMVRRGKDPFRSPTVQSSSSNNNGVQPPPYSSSSHYPHQSSHTSTTTTATNHFHQQLPPPSSLLPTEFYNQPHGTRPSPSSSSSAAAPHFVSGGSGRYNPNSPQPSRHNASHGVGTYQGSSIHHQPSPYQQPPMLGMPLGRPARPPSSSHHQHQHQHGGSQRPPHHSQHQQHPHQSRQNTTQPNGTTNTPQGSYTSGYYV